MNTSLMRAVNRGYIEKDINKAGDMDKENNIPREKSKKMICKEYIKNGRLDYINLVDKRRYKRS